MIQNPVALRIALLVIATLLHCCCAPRFGDKGAPTAGEPQKEEEEASAPSIAKLKRLYEGAQSQYERRTVSLQAIDEGALKQGRPIAVVDAIFGTHFASELPVGQGVSETV